MTIPRSNTKSLGILLNHVVFPEQLPSKHEGATLTLERDLVDGLIKAAEALVAIASDADAAIWEDVRKTLLAARNLNNDTDVEGLEKTSIIESFRQLGPNESLILHVREQNAGLLIKRNADRVVEFEAFEASPHSRDVLAAEGALQWRFPGAAAAIPLNIFTNASFQESLADFLEQCSSESFPEFASHTYKAGVELVETRESADPALISQLLMTILEALGHRTSPTLLQKRIRDDVVWGPGSEIPWRRAPYWLVLRVGLARHLDEKLGSEAGHACYKLVLCMMFSQLLSQSTGVIGMELLHDLRAKLARRIAKLQAAGKGCGPRAAEIYERILPRLEPLFHDAFRSATDCIDRTWRVTRAATLRTIHRLPLRADPNGLRLTLPNSGPILESILANQPSSNKARGPNESPDWYAGSSTTRAIVTCYSQLKDNEQEVEVGAFTIHMDRIDSQTACARISHAIGHYLNQVGSAYDGLPELQSIKILTAMEMWMVLDKRATGAIRLLLDYSPGVSASTLDVLQLPEGRDMYRLQAIQDYLRSRRRQAGPNARTVFDNPRAGSFAVRYYNECDQTGTMANLHRRIEEQSERARSKTMQEWKTLSKRYEDLSLQLAQSTCTCGTQKRSKNCTRCKIKRQRKKVKIKIHEDFLPKDQAQSKTIVFELQCPPVFAAYRNAAWSILSHLGYPSLAAPAEKTYDIREYKSLAPFRTGSSGNITLASKVKSHLRSHYKLSSVPAKLEGVLRPHGMTYSYSDATTRVWCSQDTKPSFAHLCQWTIPKTSPLTQLKTMPGFSVEGEGPSSNEILASQPQCPRGVSVHEFTAVQSLFTGRSCRWPALLVELGSSNLNFSSEAISLLVAQLAAQAGPGEPDGDALRTTHCIFRDRSFCARLADQIGQRLDLIATNWREAHMMDMLIVLLLRLASLAVAPAASTGVFGLLEKARSITHGWMKQLRGELHQAATSEVSQKLSRQMLWAALLCRRACTAAYCDGLEMQPQALQAAIEASMAVHESFCSDLAALPDSLRLAVLRDVRARGSMSRLVRAGIERCPGSLTAAIDSVWPSAAGSKTRQYSQPEFVKSSSGELVMLKVDWQGAARRQTLHYDVVSGGLWIDYKPLSQLPAEYRDNWIIKELFGGQHLLTYPSYMSGMEYMLNFTLGGHEIHFGTHEKRLIIRARYRGHTLEFLPRAVFGSLEKPDLPASLVENCVHWLNLKTGAIEARQMPDIWIQKESNWTIDVRWRLARRRNVFLVDPSSALFDHVASIFHGFEHRARLTVFQPESKVGGLSVELRRLDLSFVVKEKGLLHCRELHADVDPDQDAGTWYGFDSKIVLRDSQNAARRSILVPLGPLSWKRRGEHVAVHAENGGTYGIFTINTVLGRLDCPAEARLLLFKAVLHAYTASAAGTPDPLTRRSGTEEALHCLRSAQNQPWMPLNPAFEQYLRLLAGLAPKRTYYPPGKKVMQQVFWDDGLPAAAQHEAFYPAVAAIYQKSTQLSAFSAAESVSMSLEDRGDAHLRKRSSARRSNFWRRDRNCVEPETCCDAVYHSRDRETQGDRRARVWESSTLIDAWSAQFPVRPDLARLLRGWPTICARGEPAAGLLLSNLLGAEAAMEWGSWLSLCRTARVADKYLLCFVLGALAFRKAHDMDLVRSLIAFAVLNDLKALELPPWPSYSGFEFRQTPSASYLSQLIAPFCMPCEVRSAAEWQRIDTTCQQVASLLASQWPSSLVSIDESLEEAFSFMDFPGAIDAVTDDWVRLRHNLDLSEWVSRVQSVLNRLSTRNHTHAMNTVSDDCRIVRHSHRQSPVPHLEDLLRESCVLLEQAGEEVCGKRRLRIAMHKKGIGERTITSDGSWEHRSLSPEMRELRSIIAPMISSKSQVRSQYAKDLNQSMQALEIVHRYSNTQQIAQKPPSRTIISSADACNAASARLEQISSALEAGNNRAVWLKYGGLWPCISPVTIMERLRTTAKVQFGTGMRDALIQYGLSITEFQQHLRIDDARMRGNEKAMAEELADPGHATWNPAEHPDWLLLEIEGNLLIRPHQVSVALSTISPRSGRNSVLQMNMGQGKTSCIIPMVAAVLADAQQLVRIVVPRALLAQTAQVLQARLGNLLGREVRSVPFSRRTPTTLESINTFVGIHRVIMSSCGIIVTLPENILSFKLGGTQRLLDGRIEEARCMLKAQKWMEEVSRDVLDECDFTLATRTQLIYPSGPQESLDGHPSRWLTAEMLLELVHSHLKALKQDFPHSVRVVDREGDGFPWVYFLRPDAENALVTRLVDQIALGKTRLLTFDGYSQQDSNVLKRFIRDIEVHADDECHLEAVFKERSSTMKTIYLLRGLLAHGILILTLKKKWNVQYGLHPIRDPVAVPYHAKGVPSDQAEWGHPDVCILLTCLSFYFAGLNVMQLQKCVLQVLQSDDPASEYGRWVGSSKALPVQLQEWNVINLDDELQIKDLWQHLRYNVIVIDSFLNHFVFPVHARHFQAQIGASGWDIPLYQLQKSQSSERADGPRTPLTTGFSGTNDNRYLLPLTIEQHDLGSLAHTNADVLTYLLQPRNRGYVLAARNGERFSEEMLLYKVKELGIRVLIDAGAQILEMDNLTLVKNWMRVDTKAKAALYFNADNKPFIVYRSGTQVPLLASSFADDLRECVVYLDEAHTRGTDLKLPSNARGALTLGLAQTKDHTVQAAMRLRQLATTQSVVFFAPPEVHQSILDHRGKRLADHLNSRDVVQWLLEQTCRGIEQLQPLYRSQGIDFCRRSEIAIKFPNHVDNKKHRASFVREIRQVDDHTLQKMYQPRRGETTLQVLEQPSPALAAFLSKLKSQAYGSNAPSSTAFQEVEQEREVAHEVEAIRKVQKPILYEALPYRGLHADIILFERTGRPRHGSSGYGPVPLAIRGTQTGKKYEAAAAIFHHLLASSEVFRTVKLGKPDDNFLRPVTWLLWSTQTQTALIVTPEEAEDLISRKRGDERPMTHLLAYAAPITRRMSHFNKLDYYAVPAMPASYTTPRWLPIQLGLFAGRLYFEFDEYEAITTFLYGNNISHGSGSARWKATEQEPADQDIALPSIAPNALVFLQEWITARRKGQEFTQTPMGYVCEGKPLRAEHPFFSRTYAVSSPMESSRGLDEGFAQEIGSSDSDSYNEFQDGDFSPTGKTSAGTSEASPQPTFKRRYWSRSSHNVA